MKLTRLVVHGVLHALGYDDKRTKQRKKMFDLQEQYVACAPADARYLTLRVFLLHCLDEDQ